MDDVDVLGGLTTAIIVDQERMGANARDGRFLINSIIDDASSPPITVVHNWQPKK